MIPSIHSWLVSHVTIVMRPPTNNTVFLAGWNVLKVLPAMWWLGWPGRILILSLHWSHCITPPQPATSHHTHWRSRTQTRELHQVPVSPCELCAAHTSCMLGSWPLTGSSLAPQYNFCFTISQFWAVASVDTEGISWNPEQILSHCRTHH